MANLFDDVLRDSETLFINEMALDFDYLPKELPYREEQQKYAAECIKPLLQGKNGRNLLIIGNPGIGKTAALKWVLRELNEKYDNVETIYVNCWKKDSAYKILLDICAQIGYKWVQNKRADELLNEIGKILNKKTAVFVMDEIDKLTDMQILYNLLEDINNKSIFLITNNKKWFSFLDERIRSRMMADTLEFNSYSYEETKGILEQRKKYSFVKDAWDDEAFEAVVEKTFRVKDIRTGLFLMKEAGNNAETRSLRKILREHADDAIAKLREHKIKKSTDLENEEETIIKLIRENPDIQSNTLYDILKENLYDKSYRTLQRKIKDMEKSGLITIKEGKRQEGGFVYLLNTASKKLTEF